MPNRKNAKRCEDGNGSVMEAVPAPSGTNKARKERATRGPTPIALLSGYGSDRHALFGA
jgi:hypothetical protein